MPASTHLHKVFCENVRARRAQLGMTQQAVADLLGVTQPTYAALETGKAVPGIDIVERVGKALNLSPALLLSEQVLSEVG